MMRRFHFRHRAMLVLLVIACLAPRAAALAANRVATGTASGDLEAARALFETNLDAIRRRDRDAYVACYLHADTLARTGPDGPQWGYDSLAKETGSDWPDLFEGLGLTLIPIRPGLVYGTYRYRVRYGEKEDSGISERFFVKTDAGKTGGGAAAGVKTDAGWKIAVSTAFSAPPGTPPPPRALVGATLVDGTGSPPSPIRS